MNLEIEQQQKFTEQFFQLIKDASPKFKNKWDGSIKFLNPTHTKLIPAFSAGVIDALSIDERNKFEILRNKYYAKSL